MHNSKAHIWFIAPAIILMIIILIFPLFLAGGISFTDYNLGNKTFEWVGLEIMTRCSIEKHMSK